MQDTLRVWLAISSQCKCVLALASLMWSLESLPHCLRRCNSAYGGYDKFGTPLSQDAFQEASRKTTEAAHSWDTVLGFHVPCCFNKAPWPNECKHYIEAALNQWLDHQNITQWQR